MLKRLIFSVLLICSVVSVRADDLPSADAEAIIAAIQDLYTLTEQIGAIVDDASYALIGGRLPKQEYWTNLGNVIFRMKNSCTNLDATLTELYPKLIQQYYHIITIDDNTQSAVAQLVSANNYLHVISEVIEQLQSVIEDYENFKQAITVPLNNIDTSNTEIDTYVRAIYEDVDTIKSLFLGESNLREMLETLWDIKNDLEYFQQRWEAQNTDLHQMFLDPFDNSGFQDSYERTWEYFDRTFDPLWTWSNGSVLVSATPSNWGALDDICSGLLAILNGNQAMNYNLAYLCQGVTVIASNLMNGVNMEAKYKEFKNEFEQRSAQLMQQFNSLSEFQDGFSSVDSSKVTAIFDSQVQNFQNTFSRYSVQQLDDNAVVTLSGLGGFGANVSSVSGSLDMGSYSAFFVAARAVFGFLYWVIEFGFILWLIGKCLNLYKFTLRMFCSLPRQVSN